MDILIPLLVIVNFTLGTALLVATMRRTDEQYAKRVREEERYKSHFRGDRWD